MAERTDWVAFGERSPYTAPPATASDVAEAVTMSGALSPTSCSGQAAGDGDGDGSGTDAVLVAEDADPWSGEGEGALEAALRAGAGLDEQPAVATAVAMAPLVSYWMASIFWLMSSVARAASIVA